MLLSTVAPVVVNPDMASKNAQLTRLSVPLNRNGSMPTTENKTHVELTIKKPSRRPMRFSNPRPANFSNMPPRMLRKVGRPSESKASSW